MEKDYNNREPIYNIMNITQSNYSNMLKRLERKKVFSNYVITYYSIGLIIYSLTAEFFPDSFNIKLSSYFNIILSIVVLAYSLISSNAKYSERIQSVENILNEIKSKKRELTEKNVEEKRKEYDEIMKKAEYRSELDFFRTLKQQCKENNIRWYCYKKDINDINNKDMRDEKKEIVERLNNYLSENFPLTQQIKIIFSYMWDAIIFIIPICLLILCFSIDINIDIK